MSESEPQGIPPAKKKKRKVKKKRSLTDASKPLDKPSEEKTTPKEVPARDKTSEDMLASAARAAEAEQANGDILLSLDLDPILVGTVDDLKEHLSTLASHPQSKVVEFASVLGLPTNVCKDLLTHYANRNLVVRKWVAGAGRYSLTDAGVSTLSSL